MRIKELTEKRDELRIARMKALGEFERLSGTANLRSL